MPGESKSNNDYVIIAFDKLCQLRDQYTKAKTKYFDLINKYNKQREFSKTKEVITDLKIRKKDHELLQKLSKQQAKLYTICNDIQEQSKICQEFMMGRIHTIVKDKEIELKNEREICNNMLRKHVYIYN